MKHPESIATQRSPIYRDNAFIFESLEACQRTFQQESTFPQSAEHYIYTRYGNPTIRETEAHIARLEGSQWAVLTASGMAAIDTALSIFQQRDTSAPWLFFSEIYGGTNTYISEVLQKRRGLQIERFTPRQGEERYRMDDVVECLDRVRPQVLYFEPVSNPLLIVADGKAIIREAKARGITVVVDNTFATPLLWRPLEDGADLVVHSGTKYFGGHGNITAGVICGNDEALHKDVLFYRKVVGNILSPDDAYRLGTQLETFDLRVARQCENAFKLAKVLTFHARINNVRYPGLQSHPSHDEAMALFGERGFGAMITFELKDGQAASETFITAIAEHVKFMTTLGDPASMLIHVPTVFTAERFPFPGMIRFSVGYEAYEKLERNVLRALEALI